MSAGRETRLFNLIHVRLIFVKVTHTELKTQVILGGLWKERHVTASQHAPDPHTSIPSQPVFASVFPRNILVRDLLVVQS